jgi:hypothetical protein
MFLTGTLQADLFVFHLTELNYRSIQLAISAVRTSLEEGQVLGLVSAMDSKSFMSQINTRSSCEKVLPAYWSFSSATTFLFISSGICH